VRLQRLFDSINLHDADHSVSVVHDRTTCLAFVHLRIGPPDYMAMTGLSAIERDGCSSQSGTQILLYYNFTTQNT
jgi:hypothetical protein